MGADFTSIYPPRHNKGYGALRRGIKNIIWTSSILLLYSESLTDVFVLSALSVLLVYVMFVFIIVSHSEQCFGQTIERAILRL